MARKAASSKRTKSKKRKGKKTSLVSMPTETDITVWGSSSSSRMLKINSPLLLSQMNMRLYRQSRNYKMKISLADLNSDFGNNFQIFTLPNTWLTHGAIRHAYKMYKLSMEDELKQTGGKTSKWHDFRINGADVDGTATAAQLVMFDGNTWAEAGAAADTSLSVVTPEGGTTEHGFHVVGNVSNSYNIITEYVKHILSRGNEAQAVSGPQAYEGLIDSADDLDNLLERGDLPPYDKDFAGWAGDASADSNTSLVLQDTLFYNRSRDTHDLDGSTSDYDTYVPLAHRLVSKTFEAPLGLVWIFADAADMTYTTRPQFKISYAKGNYKGVDSQPIVNYNL